MPIQSSQSNDPKPITSRVTALMGTVRSPARKKAILTFAKNHNLTRSDAKFQQAIKIAQSQYRKGK